jgi:signal transduction histidine kinase/ligand-binding sensor domain-containing protein
MWFGTDNGLARFDGRRIQNFSLGSDDSDRILSLKTSTSGELWIGTRAGAFIFSENQFQAVENSQNVGIPVILLGTEMYLGTDDGFVMRVERSESGAPFAEKLFAEPIRQPGGDPLAITSIVELNGGLLAGTSGRGTFVLRDGNVSELPSAPRPLFVNSLTTDENGKPWLGTDAAKGVSGVFSEEVQSRLTKIAAPTAKVMALNADKSGVWAGTERYGLFHFTDSKLDKSYTFANTSGGLRSDTIFTLFTDREGVLWIGTNRGVSRYDPEGPFQQQVSDSPNSNFIRTFWQSGDGRATLAGSNRGLFSYHGKNWNKVPGFEERTVYSVGPTMDDMAVGTPTGTFDSNGKLLAAGDTRSLEMFHGETYAAIFGRGVVDLDNKQDVIFPDETANALLVGDGKLWIGTAGHGLFSFDGKALKLEVSPDILKSGTIWKIYENEDHSVWIAGQHGVFVFSNGQVEQVIAAEDVRDVFTDGADVWAATTTRGLLHARRDDQFGWLISDIGFEQGLPSDKAFSIQRSDKGLLVATNRGIVTYYPHSFAPAIIPIRVLSRRMHDVRELASTIALDYPQNSLLVEVAGQSSRTFPEEFQYAFILKNAKGQEIDRRLSNEPQYTPANLSSGEYSIESRAFDRDLNSSEPLIIRFSVAKAPFPWTATTLGVLLALALIALVWAVVERRRITLRNRELAAARLDLTNEAERERRRIARDLHDQTLADLRNLMITSDKILPDDKGFRAEIEAVSTEVRRICEDLSPSVLENVGLVAALEFLLSHTVENQNFSADESVEEQINFPLNVQLQIYRIAQEVLTNINRHSNAALVEMSVAISEEVEFLLKIRDDGTRFQPDPSLGKGRGISNIRSRANLINAKVAWKERRKGGNIFSLRIPA